MVQVTDAEIDLNLLRVLDAL
ncbi:MAG: hypothetical protein RLZZ93_1354, partial [Actinomycetota bacterium]